MAVPATCSAASVAGPRSRPSAKACKASPRWKRSEVLGRSAPMSRSSMSAPIKAAVPSSAEAWSARRRSMAMKAACAPTRPETSSRRSARASMASMPPQGTSFARSSSAASGSCSTTRERPKIIAEAMPLSRSCSSLPSSFKQAGKAVPGSWATVAAREVAARRHSLGPNRGERSRWISAARRGAATANSPRATATCLQTSDSRSVMSRLHAVRTVERSNTRIPLSSPSLARLAASRAARSSRRAANRRAGNAPMECADSQSRSSSGRETKARAKPSTCATEESGKRNESATRARIRGPPSARGEDSASAVARVTKVAASPSCRATSTRRPSSRFSGLGGKAPANSKRAAAASGRERNERSSTRPAPRAERRLASNWSVARPSSGVGCWSAAAAARLAMPCRQSERRSSRLSRV